MSKIKIILLILAMLFGVFVFIFGGYDDSPGAQLLGVIIFALAVWRMYKNLNNIKKSQE